MRIRDIYLTDFKRFTNLKIEGIPDTAKLVILVGPSGSGKSSLFDAINTWGKNLRSGYDIEYYRKDGQPTDSPSREWSRNLGVDINADDCPSNLRETCYIRSAYRHTSKFSVSTVTQINESEYRHLGQRNLSAPDTEVERNYHRICRQIMKEVFNPQERTNVEIKEQVIGQVRDSLQSIFLTCGCILLKTLRVGALSILRKERLKNTIMSICRGVRKRLLICFLILSSGENITLMR